MLYFPTTPSANKDLAPQRAGLPDTGLYFRREREGHKLAPVTNHRKDKTLLLVLYKEEDPAIPVPECICLESM